MNTNTEIFLLARPGKVRDGYRALLKEIPGTQVIEMDEWSYAEKIIQNNPPDLVLVEASVLSESGRLKMPFHQTRGIRFMILEEDPAKIAEWLMRGADQVALVGSPVLELFTELIHMCQYKIKKE
jgi:hypothetical protein